jgi:hypothetical protein
MADFVTKLSSYNLFNYLLPGIIFVILADTVTNYSFSQENVITGLFLYYFIGMVISRVGSLIVEPVLKRISFVKFAEYKDYVNASKKDERLELLSEVNNTYRTLCALFMVTLLLVGYEKLEGNWPFLRERAVIILTVLLLLLFLVSYRKQAAYVAQRCKMVG